MPLLKAKVTELCDYSVKYIVAVPQNKKNTVTVSNKIRTVHLNKLHAQRQTQKRFKHGVISQQTLRKTTTTKQQQTSDVKELGKSDEKQARQR